MHQYFARVGELYFSASLVVVGLVLRVSPNDKLACEDEILTDAFSLNGR